MSIAFSYVLDCHSNRLGCRLGCRSRRPPQPTLHDAHSTVYFTQEKLVQKLVPYAAGILIKNCSVQKLHCTNSPVVYFTNLAFVYFTNLAFVCGVPHTRTAVHKSNPEGGHTGPHRYFANSPVVYFTNLAFVCGVPRGAAGSRPSRSSCALPWSS